MPHSYSRLALCGIPFGLMLAGAEPKLLAATSAELIREKVLRQLENSSAQLASQTATSITIKAAQGLTDTILRSELKEMQSSGLSLMPEGLESAINHQEMAD